MATVAEGPRVASSAREAAEAAEAAAAAAGTEVGGAAAAAAAAAETAAAAVMVVGAMAEEVAAAKVAEAAAEVVTAAGGAPLGRSSGSPRTPCVGSRAPRNPSCSRRRRSRRSRRTSPDRRTRSSSPPAGWDKGGWKERAAAAAAGTKAAEGVAAVAVAVVAEAEASAEEKQAAAVEAVEAAAVGAAEADWALATAVGGMGREAGKAAAEARQRCYAALTGYAPRHPLPAECSPSSDPRDAPRTPLRAPTKRTAHRASTGPQRSRHQPASRARPSAWLFCPAGFGWRMRSARARAPFARPGSRRNGVPAVSALLRSSSRGTAAGGA